MSFNPHQWYLQGPIKSKLVAHFKLNGNANDSVNANNGTDVGALTYVTGKFDSAAAYVADSYNSIPHSTNYNFYLGVGIDYKYTFNLWIKVNAINRTSFLLTKRRAGNPEFTLFAVVSGSNVSFAIRNVYPPSSGYIQFESVSVPYTSGVFDMLTVTYDGSTLPSGFKLYYNNVLLSGTPSLLNTYPNYKDDTGALLIGNEIGSPTTRYSSIDIDSVSIWKNEELSTIKINELFNGGLGKDYPF